MEEQILGEINGDLTHRVGEPHHPQVTTTHRLITMFWSFNFVKIVQHKKVFLQFNPL